MISSISTPFIKRPVLTTVCTILVILLGTVALGLLPSEKLPEIAPKRVSVTANYVGADARTTVDNVTNVLEREINGVEDAKWIDSNTTNTGTATINITFPVEKDSNTAQVLVQNRVSQAQSDLPEVVISTGITTEKQSPSVTLAYGFTSAKDADGNFLYDKEFVYNYVDRYLWNDLKRIKGVGSLNLLGSAKYAMRIWLDPSQLAARGLTTNDVVNAIQEQNFEVGSGGIGQQPAADDQEFERPLRVIGRFETPEEAENIVLKIGEGGNLVRVKDVGRVELGVENYFTDGILDGDVPAAALIIYQLPGTNALDTANAVKAKLAELSDSFPPGLEAVVAFDSTLFVDASISEAVISLIQAIVLVVLIIFVFLQDWRTTIIPGIAIPVALLGSIIGMLLFDFSLNQLSLFACILATGLVVDDGVVVVESVSTKLSQGMRPLQAALDSMEELAGAVVATSLVLLAVFIPVSFFPGTTGIVYRQFALTIVFAIVFSTFNALSFSPTMSGILLKPQSKTNGPLGVFFNGFNVLFDRCKGGYRWLIELLTKIKPLVIMVFVGGLVATGWIYSALPQGFVPEEDQGYLFGIVEAPPGVSLNYTQAINKQVMEEVMQFDEVQHALGLSGFSFDGQNANKGIFFIQLKPWEERVGPESSAFGLQGRMSAQFAQKISGARVFAVNAPPVDGLSNFGGLEIYIQDRQLKGMDALIANTQSILAAANQREEIGAAFSTFTFSSPLFEADIDRNTAKAQDVAITDILTTLQTQLGSNFVNQYVLDGRLYRVYVQADGDFRDSPEDITQLYVRSQTGSLVQLSNLLTMHEVNYPPIVTNYNVFPSIKLNVAPAQGFSSGQVIQVMEQVAAEALQPGFGYEWTATAAEEKEAGGAAPIVFGFGFIMVFLVLAAQYESYVDPTIIMLTVPLAILGALGGIWFRAAFIQTSGIWPILNNNIYCQVGLVMLIGLASKNAILIVEFANQARELGMDITRAAITAAEQRFRPILMTAISTLVGFVPLIIASGAGSVSRWSLGTAVFSGMLISTALSLLMVPILYIVVKEFEDDFLKGNRSRRKPKPSRLDRGASKPEAPSQNGKNGKNGKPSDTPQSPSKTTV